MGRGRSKKKRETEKNKTIEPKIPFSANDNRSWETFLAHNSRNSFGTSSVLRDETLVYVITALPRRPFFPSASGSLARPLLNLRGVQAETRITLGLWSKTHRQNAHKSFSTSQWHTSYTILNVSLFLGTNLEFTLRHQIKTINTFKFFFPEPISNRPQFFPRGAKIMTIGENMNKKNVRFLEKALPSRKNFCANETALKIHKFSCAQLLPRNDRKFI